ncbi:MAG: DUF5615 family PIN-like protein [Gammaproteobacteria bacterium]|nr:DUF5615 family PIN-like protein [Gammaproteobacteria bacterium]
MNTAPRLLCDEMLKGLARWLRAAGYDTLILQDGEDDARLIARAVEEDRILLTRDRPMLQHRDARRHILLLHGNGLHDCAQELTTKLHIDWQYRPFSRCMLCNSPLEEATERQRRRIPQVMHGNGLTLYCPHCDKLYWEGSHVERMRRHLQRWHQGDFRAD